MQSLNIVFPEPRKIELREEPVDDPGAGMVLCQAERSLISIGTESICLQGRFDPGTNWDEWVKFPFHPGYGMGARVIGVGTGVTGLKEGDLVASSSTHRQYFTTAADHVQRIPEGLSVEDGAWKSLACTTQLGVRRAALALGETVGVIGCGMLGQLVTQYLRVAGARRIIVMDPIQSRLDLAAAHGATHTLPLSVADARDEIARITDGAMLDVVFDITGHPAVLAPSIRLLRRLGRVVLLGDTPVPTQQHLGPGFLSNSISILSIHGNMSPQFASEFNPWTADVMTDLFFDYLLQGRMNVADLVTSRHDPREAPAVYEGLLRDRSASIGVIFDWSRL